MQLEREVMYQDTNNNYVMTLNRMRLPMVACTLLHELLVLDSN